MRCQRMWPCLLIGVLLLGSPGCDGGGDGDSGALVDITDDELAGQWLGTEAGGSAGEWMFAFRGNHCYVVSPTGAEDYIGQYSLGSGTNPRDVDLTVMWTPTGSFEGDTALGIYRLIGGVLTGASTPPGWTPRATDFTPTVTTRVWNLTAGDRATHNLTGHWARYLVPASGPEVPYGFHYLSQMRGTLAVVSYDLADTGIVDGTAVLVSEYSSPTDYFHGEGTTTSANEVDMSAVSKFDGGVGGTWAERWVRYNTPAGSLALSGTCDSVAVSTSTSEAAYLRLMEGATLYVGLALATPHENVLVNITNTDSLTVGTLSIVPGTTSAGEVGVQFYYETPYGTLTDFVDAQSGTLTVTQYDATRITGSISLTFAGSQTVTGTFDLPVTTPAP